MRLRFLKHLVPPAWRPRVRRWLRRPIYRGDYASWAQARAASRGYDDPAIFEKALAATRAVRDGRAAWERDTVLFPEPACNEPLLAALRRAAAFHRGKLNLVDYGGALGSTWWQHRTWLADLVEVRWSIIEQPHFVAAGQGEFATGPLRFYASLEECGALEEPRVILFSSVLPYLSQPYEALAEVRRRPFTHVIIDRTGFVAGERDRLTVQRVPASIYDASYPCWFLAYPKLVADFGADWSIVQTWSTTDTVDIDAEYRGLMFERRR